jgi:hypothetical protein
MMMAQQNGDFWHNKMPLFGTIKYRFSAQHFHWIREHF